MKIAIIAANNIRYSPYINYYARLFDELNLDYELIYPDRSSVEDLFNKKTHRIRWNRKLPVGLEYWNYARKVKSIIKRVEFDFLVVLTTNNAVYMAHWLKRHYYGKYIVDIRDYTHENISLFFKLETIAVSHSAMNVISSRKFKDFLPRAEYHICHNTNGKTPVLNPFIKRNQRIRIGYIGQGSYLTQCVKICEKLCSDDRFEFVFYGLKSIPEELKPYEKYENIAFNGVFTPDEKPGIISGVDLLFNVYGNGCPLLDCALSNKLYDALMYGKPILTSPHTYMSEMAGPFSFEVDLGKETFLDDMYKWYNNLDENELREYAQATLRSFDMENKETKRCVQNSVEMSVI